MIRDVPARIQMLVLLLVVAGLAACEAEISSGPGGDGSLVDFSPSDAFAGADGGARPDCRGPGCNPDGHLPDGHLPDGHLPDSHLPDSHLPDSHLPDSHLPDSHLPDSHPPDSQSPTVTHETEFITWNLYNNAGCTSSNGVAKWYDRNNGPGPLSIQDTLLTQDPAILALQEDGKLGPADCAIGSVKDKVASWLSSTHDVRSTDDVSGGWTGERYGILIKKSKYRFISAGYQKCYYNGSEVRGFMWAEVDLISDSTSNHFYVLNAHFKAYATSADIAQRAAQAQCVIDWVNAKKVSHPNRAHFLLGDLNSGPDHNNQAYAMLTGPGGPFENTSTAGTNDIDTHGSHWIDHVLGTKNDFTKVGYRSWTVGAGQVQNGGTLSDHLGLRTRIGHLK